MKAVLLGILFLHFTAWAQLNGNADETAVEDQDIEVRVAKDGRYTVIEKTVLGAESEAGRAQLRRQKFSFDPTLSDIEVLEAGVRVGDDNRDVPLASVQRKANGALASVEIPFGEVPSDAVVWWKLKRTAKVAPAGFFSMDFVFGILRLEKKGEIRVISENPLYFQVNDPHQILAVQSTPVDAGYEVRIRLTEPVLSVASETLRVATEDELRADTPRVQVSNAGSWADIVTAVRHRQEEVSAAPLPPPLADLAKGIKDLPSSRAKVEKVLLWLGENISARAGTLFPSAPPRDLNVVVKSRTADSREAAFLAWTVLRQAGVDAEPVFVGSFSEQDRLRFLHSPIDEKSPLPSVNYFNRMAVSYREGGKAIVVDPVRGLAEAVRPPYYFNRMLALDLGAKAGEPYQIRVPAGGGYAEVVARTEMSRQSDGEYRAQARVEFRGEMANFLRDVYFREGEAGLRNYLEAFASVSRHRGFTYRKLDYFDRRSKNLRVEMSFATLEPSGGGRRTLVMPPHYMPFYSRPGAGLNFTAIPVRIDEVTTVKGAFVAEEEKYDCTVFGPLANVQRRVSNLDGAVSIRDLVTVPAAPAPGLDDDDQSRLAMHATHLSACAQTGKIVVVRQGKGQKSFADGLDLEHPYVLSEATLHDPDAWAGELRKIDAYLAAGANDGLWRERGRLLQQMGQVSGDVYILEHLAEAENNFKHAMDLNPQAAANVAEWGINALYQNDLGKALEAFNRSSALDAKSFPSLFLGGLVSRHTRKLDLAAGYFASAASVAIDKEDKIRALVQQAEVLCGDLQRCPASLAVHAKILELEPKSAEHLHQAAQAYSRAAQLEKAVELERLALAQDDSPMIRDELLRMLVALSENSKKSAVQGSEADFNALQKNLKAAYELDKSNPRVLALLVETNVARAEALFDKAPLTAARQYLAELRAISEDDTTDYDLQAHALEVVSQSLSRSRLPSSKSP
jgi:tetratricopeptide (TPR) repeat protein